MSNPLSRLVFKFVTVFTTLQFNSSALQRTVRFCEQLSTVIPNSHVYYRRGLALKRIIPQCIARDFTDLIVINEDRKIPSILCVHTKINAVLALGCGGFGFFLQCVS